MTVWGDSVIDLRELNARVADVLRQLTRDASSNGGQRPAASSRQAPRRLASTIDYTLLRPDATSVAIDALCDTAIEQGYAAVCINSCWVSRAASRLASSTVKVASVVGFPLGASATDVKAYEADFAVDAGAEELDVVAPIGQMVDEEWPYVARDVGAVVKAARGHVVKVILETGVLSPELTVKAALVCRDAGAGFVKTSTGFHQNGGATVAAVQLLRCAVGASTGVKASGGIRDVATAWDMIRAGADRIGTSARLIDSDERIAP